MAVPAVIKNYREFIIGVSAFAVLIAILLAFAATGWGGRRADPDTCFEGLDGGGCFCENIRVTTDDEPVLHPSARRAWIKQPVNTWSNLGFVAVGLSMLWWLGWERATGRRAAYANRITATPFYATAFGLIVMYMGPGAMFFHASLKNWGGWLDAMSMYLFIGFVLVYNLARTYDFNRIIASVIFILLVGLAGVFAWGFEGIGRLIFTGIGVGAIVAQVLFARRPDRYSAVSGHWWFFAGLMVFLSGFGIWYLSWTGNPLCAPRSFFQGHGYWHLASAATAGSLYMYFRTETLTPTTVPAVLRVLSGTVIGGVVAGIYHAVVLDALGAGETAVWIVGVAMGLFGAVYSAVAFRYEIYRVGFLSMLGLLLDLTWSMLNTIAGFLVWAPVSIATSSGFVTPSADSQRSGSFVYKNNPRGGGYAATTVGTVIAGGWCAHEEVHVWQARILGPLYLVLYGLNLVFAMLFALIPSSTRTDPVHEGYHRVVFEDWAYWGGSSSGSKVHGGAWVGGLMLGLLFVSTFVPLVVGFALGSVLLIVLGALVPPLYPFIRAFLPRGH